MAAAIVIVALLGLLASPAAGRGGVGSSEVTVDFSTGGFGALDTDFYRLDGIGFPSQRCGPAGCEAWVVSLVQGDAALLGAPRFGPVEATFTRPISDLSLRVAPGLQGTATYVLKAYTASGELIATTSRTVTQDFGDPENTGFGYFTIAVTSLEKPAKRFTLDNVFVRSSFPSNQEIEYGVSSISYAHWGKQP